MLGGCRRDRRHEGEGERARVANRSYEQIAREIFAEVAETDRREDELHGYQRGDDLPEHVGFQGSSQQLGGIGD